MRKTQFELGNFYHIYNRGVDKRNIFENKEDFLRFYECIQYFNSLESTGGFYQETLSKNKNYKGSTFIKSKRLVNFVAFCINQNHYHFILEPLVDNGIQKIMHRISTGYTMYFNQTHKRSGSLFQGRYKSVHIDTNEYLLHLSVYVNLNDRVHEGLNKNWMKELPFSSWNQYIGMKNIPFCNPSIVLEQFKNKEKYKIFAEQLLPIIVKRKKDEKDLNNIFFDTE